MGDIIFELEKEIKQLKYQVSQSHNRAAKALDALRANDFPLTERVDLIADVLAPKR